MLASKDVGCGDHKVLVAIKGADLEIVLNSQVVLARLKSAHMPPKFAETRHGGRSGPDDEVLVSHIDPLFLLPVRIALDVFV